jgi:3-oxoacyl-[acyl-carrier protein] reductase
MTTVDPSLIDRVCIVTGGGRGLGRVMALALAEAGARVLITAARRPAELDEVVRLGQGRVIGMAADVTQPGDCAAVAQRALQEFGAIHVLVNNAGRGMREVSESFNTTPTRFWETPDEAWTRIIDVNLNGVFRMTRAVAPTMLAQGFGKIVNISTSQPTMVRAGYSPYGPSKAGMEAASRVWANELAGTGVTVNVLLPGGASDTEFIPGAGAGRRGADGQLLPPAIMALPMLWLASDRSNGRTGERYTARLWDPALPPDQAAAKARAPHAELPQIM